jgi:hypothetical protein
MYQQKLKKLIFSKQKNSAHIQSQIKYKYKIQITNIHLLNLKNGTLNFKTAIRLLLRKQMVLQLTELGVQFTIKQ